MAYNGYMDNVYAVAVNTRPLQWVIYCEICDENIGDHSDNDIYLDAVENEHSLFHGLDIPLPDRL